MLFEKPPDQLGARHSVELDVECFAILHHWYMVR